jgi:hypothetical protein
LIPAILAAALVAATAQVKVQIGGRPARAWASSQLKSKDGRYAVKNAFDGDPATAWVEGAPGLGEGQSLFLRFQRRVKVSGFLLVAGNARSQEALLQHAVPAQVEIRADGKRLLKVDLAWAQAFEPAPNDDGPGQCPLIPGAANLAPRLVVLSAPVTAREFQLRLSKVQRGSKFEDTAISEWQPLLAGAPAVLGRESYQDARAALASLRKRGRELLATTALADGLLPWPKGQKGARYPGYDALIEKRLRGAKLSGANLSGAQAWLRAFRPELLNHAVVVLGGPGSRRLIGARAWSEGEEEWDELYPALTLDGQGRIARLQNLFHRDGTPGCKGALPDDIR